MGALPRQPACQSIVGNAGRRVPGDQDARCPRPWPSTRSRRHRRQRVHLLHQGGHTILYPITDKAPQINLIVQPTLEEFLNGTEPRLEGLNTSNMNDPGQRPAQVRGRRAQPPPPRGDAVTRRPAAASGRDARHRPPRRPVHAATRSPGRTAGRPLRFNSRSSLYLAAIVGAMHLTAGHHRTPSSSCPFLLFVNLLLALNWLVFAAIAMHRAATGQTVHLPHDPRKDTDAQDRVRRRRLDGVHPQPRRRHPRASRSCATRRRSR